MFKNTTRIYDNSSWVSPHAVQRGILVLIPLKTKHINILKLLRINPFENVITAKWCSIKAGPRQVKKTTTNSEITHNGLWIRPSCCGMVKPFHVSHMVLMSQLCFCWIPEVWSRVCLRPVLNIKMRDISSPHLVSRGPLMPWLLVCFLWLRSTCLWRCPFWSVLSPAAHTLSFRWIIRGLLTVLFKGTDWGRGNAEKPTRSKKKKKVHLCRYANLGVFKINVLLMLPSLIWLWHLLHM